MSLTLGDICSPRQHPTISGAQLKESGYSVYGANGQIGFYSSYTHARPTIAVTCRGATCGTIHIVPAFSYITGNAMALDNLDETKADLSYLAWCLRARGFQDVISGSAQPQITGQPLRQIKLALPPLSEQRRLAAILDQADDLRKKRRLALEKLNALPQAIFQEMFGDPIVNPHNYQTDLLDTLIDISRGISYGIVQRGLDQAEGVNVLRISDLDGDRINTGELKKTSPSIASKYRRTRLRGGEIVISIRGTIGRCAIVPESLADSNVSRELAVIPIVSCKMPSQFLLALLRAPAVQDRLTRDVKGVAQSGINLEDLRKLPIIQPSSERVAKFLHTLEKLRIVVDANSAYLDRCEQLFASLQHHAFAGTLAPSASVATLPPLQPHTIALAV